MQLTKFTQPVAVILDQLASLDCLCCLVPRCTSELALLLLSWPHQFPGVLAADDHLPRFWLVCPEGKAGWVSPQSGWAILRALTLVHEFPVLCPLPLSIITPV